MYNIYVYILIELTELSFEYKLNVLNFVIGFLTFKKQYYGFFLRFLK